METETTPKPPRRRRETFVRGLISAQELLYEAAESNPAAFFAAAWKVIEPSTKLKWNWHHGCIAEYMHATYLGQIKRLVINQPPRTLKSNIVTVTFPVWCWLQDPGMRFMFGSYSDRLSTKHSSDRRSIIESPWHRYRWGDKYRLSPDQNMKTFFQNDKRGHMLATTMHGAATGLGASYLVIDDPHNPRRANSDVLRDADIASFQNTFTQRLDDPETGRIVIVMQRLHNQDLSGEVLSKNLGYEHLCLPQQAEAKTIIVFPISKREMVREDGSLLQSSRVSIERLAQIREETTEADFQAQQQQSPVSLSGEIFKSEFIQFWHHKKDALPPIEYPNAKVCQIPMEFTEQIQSWDLTFKDKETSDYVAGQCWKAAGTQFYFFDQIREIMGFKKSCEAVLGFSAKHDETKEKCIEDAANGPALEDILKDKIAGLILVSVKGMSKPERARAVEHLWEGRNVWLPHPEIAPWVRKFIATLLKFPQVKNDDEIDAFTQALIRLDKKTKVKSTDVTMISMTRQSPWST